MEIITSAKVTRPGAYRMPEHAYHGDPCPEPSLSNSLAQLFLDASPRHVWYAHPRLNPAHARDGHSRRTALGSVCHAMLLGQGAELEIIDADDYRTKAAKEARDMAEAAGHIPILAAEHARAAAIVTAARLQLGASGLHDLADGRGDSEVAIFANDAGLWMRCLADWWSPDRYTFVDYKTTIGLASPAAFAAQIARMGYDFQAAWYLRTAGCALPAIEGRMRFLFAAQEIEPPYALSVCEIGEADLHVARRKVDAALATWAYCREQNAWPGYPTGVQLIQLPEWHTRRWLDREMAEDSDSPSWQFAGGQR